MRDPSYKKPTDKIITIPVSPSMHKRINVVCAEKGVTKKQFGTDAFENLLQIYEKERY